MIRTIIVEDDFRVAAIHQQYTERLPGFSVVGQARTGAEALDLAQRTSPDLVLLDIFLPDLSGLEVLRRLRAPGRPPVDVIVITGAKDVETLHGAIQGGSLHYLVKPFSFSTFREKLQRYAALRGRLSAMAEVEQAEVDQVFGLMRTSLDGSLPKGLSTTTLALVTGVIRTAKEGISAGDVAHQASISRVTARRYLKHLASSGRVELSMRYGTSGRPEHRYRWIVGT